MKIPREQTYLCVLAPAHGVYIIHSIGTLSDAAAEVISNGPPIPTGNSIWTDGGEFRSMPRCVAVLVKPLASTVIS